MIRRNEGDPYENLANAIVAQAADDYLTALRKLKGHPGNKAAMTDAMELGHLNKNKDPWQDLW